MNDPLFGCSYRIGNGSMGATIVFDNPNSATVALEIDREMCYTTFKIRRPSRFEWRTLVIELGLTF
jgi:hypothetical protein